MERIIAAQRQLEAMRGASDATPRDRSTASVLLVTLTECELALGRYVSRYFKGKGD